MQATNETSTSPVVTTGTEYIRVGVDQAGRLHELINAETGINYAGGELLWRLYYTKGLYEQNEINADACRGKLERIERGLRLQYESLPSVDGDLAISLTIEVHVEENRSTWTATVRNDTQDITVKELQFPLIGRLNVAGHSLITSSRGGQRHDDPVAFARQGARAPYCDEDYLGVQNQQMYPGVDAASNCFVFDGGPHGLYCGNHDDTFRNTVHLYRTLGGDLETGFVKHLFLRPGQSITLGDFVLAPYAGTWHTAAEIYRAWAGTWMSAPPAPAWIKDFYGWQRLIMRHQNGEILFPYDSMPRIYEEGDKAGVDTLFMFGWWPHGMDRMYPDYVPDPDMGGEEGLRRGIADFRKRGGKVILYASGRLVDRQSAWFQRHGEKCALKTRSGAVVGDSYLFSNRCSFERCYGAVELAAMCLDTSEWITVLESVVDKAVEYGCDGVFFDQLGLQEYPCYDTNHGHDVPNVTQWKGKRKALAHLREYARKRDPDLAFGAEVFADCIAPYCDFFHGIYHGNLDADNDWAARGEKPHVTNFVDWMRYVYPEVVISDRDIRDRQDIPRRVNHALQRGLIHDIEIYRCRKTIAEVPEYQTYLRSINDLRRRHHDLLRRGTYRDTRGFAWDDREADARACVAGNRMAVVVCQSHRERVSGSLRVPGYRYAGFDCVNEASVEDGGEAQKVVLGRHGLAVVLYERSKNSGSRR